MKAKTIGILVVLLAFGAVGFKWYESRNRKLLAEDVDFLNRSVDVSTETVTVANAPITAVVTAAEAAQ